MPSFLRTVAAILTISIAALGQSVTGKVSDQNRAPISGASVYLRADGNELGRTETSADGSFSLNLQVPRGGLLVVRAMGFEEQQIELDEQRLSDIDIVLRPSAIAANVTVTVTGVESRLLETPASVLVLDRERLVLTSAQTIDDALRQVAGFSLFRRSSSKTTNPTAQGANLRGISGSGASRAAVEIDGLSLNDAFGGWTYWSRVPRVAVEQAEMLRGGASSFYGTAGLSGAVDLRTAAIPERSILRVQASAGSQNTYDAGIFAASRIYGWEIGLASETFQTGGYIPVAPADRGLADTRATSRHGNAILNIGRRFRIGSSEGKAFARGNLFGERRDNGTSLTYNQTSFRQASVGVDVESGRAGMFTFRGFVEKQIYDQSFSAVSADRNSETLTRLQQVPSQAVGGSVQWSRVANEHSFSVRSEMRTVRGYSDEVGYFGGRPTSLTGTGGVESSLSVSIHDLWRVSERIILSLGGRIDRWENRDALSVTRSLTTGSAGVTEFADRSQTALSPRLALLFQADSRIALYGAYSRSFRAPTLNELYRGFRVGDTLTLANENLVSEAADTLEGGVSYSKPNFSLRGNLFFTRVSDPVVSITLNATPSLITRQRQNVGATRTAGIELDAEFRPRPEMRFSAGYLFADSRISDFPANPVLEGRFLPQVPKQQFTFQAFYSPESKFSMGFQGRISGRQFEDDLNTRRLGAFFAADATAAYPIRRGLEIFAATENIFNNRYDIGLTPVRTVASGVTVRVGLRLELPKR